MTRPICILCKGSRMLCGEPRCSLLEGIYDRIPTPCLTRTDIQGSSPPAVFVGRYGYPDVSVGPVLPPMRMDNAERLNDPTQWFGRPIEEIVSDRFSLIRGNTRLKVSTQTKLGPMSDPQMILSEMDRRKTEISLSPTGRRILETSQLLAMGTRSVDVDMRLTRLPSGARPTVSSFTAPYGPSADIRSATLLGNPHIPNRVQALTSDTDAKATTAVGELFKAGIPVRHIQQLLAIGLLGKKGYRRLVPTRWSITATDDMLGKQVAKAVLLHPQIDKIEVYWDQYIGNHFYVILLPYSWHFEMVETWLKGAFWASEPSIMVDYEGPRGRKGYASQITGAYYTARLEVLDHLQRRRRQAACLIYREITDEYWAPLGVWVIGETVKNALKKKPLIFEDPDFAVRFVTRRVIGKTWHTKSKLLKQYKTQKRIEDY